MNRRDFLRRLRNAGNALASVGKSGQTGASEAEDVEPLTMGKSNKFDYTNRSNSGAKLGQIIGHALEKEADKVQKDAGKQATKSRKQSMGSSSVGSTDGRDHTVHVLDIRTPSKQLGDDGVCALADGLEIALRNGGSLASLALEDLNISENQITTVSLARLASIIDLAKHDLKTLNLSNNNIKVETPEEARQWEAFLVAFKSCLKLRRIDLSGNKHLGAKALEVLARVHLREHPINPMPATGEISVQSLTETYRDGDETTETPTQDDFNGSGAIHGNPLAHARYLKRRCGLRSVPYFNLQDIGLTDAGALWLSYALEDHHYPSQLIDGLNAAQADSTIKIYQQGTHLRGIEWNGHEASLGRDGHHVLQKTEAIRKKKWLDDRSMATHKESLELSDGESEVGGQHETVLRTSLDRKSSKSSKASSNDHRAASMRSIRTSDGGEHEVSELDSARKKIQRSIIAQHGASSVDLWRSALRTVVTYRILIFSKPASRIYYCGPPLFCLVANDDEPSRDHSKPRSTSSMARNDPACRFKHVGYNGRDLSSPATTTTARSNPFAVGSSERAITEVTNTVRPPKKMATPHRDKEASRTATADADLVFVTRQLDHASLAIPPRGPRAGAFVRWQQARLATGSFRDTSAPSHLPRAVMDRVLGELMDASDRAAMTDQQRDAAFTWAKDRATFDVQRDWRKMADSAQVWTLLEAVGCLTYQK